ncbi:hypothetical protein C5167_021815 [Papaver somniferum]|uniref:Uncharacterized protein n=1 Tax=Papaver somniferum TaxID=3469 RepID=A0A4Y7JHP3_PAPSO|nr:hypothetical protein C5167_021815 [Papaver somniferum]
MTLMLSVAKAIRSKMTRGLENLTHFVSLVHKLVSEHEPNLPEHASIKEPSNVAKLEVYQVLELKSKEPAFSRKN